jgi:hypothetical protein
VAKDWLENANSMSLISFHNFLNRHAELCSPKFIVRVVLISLIFVKINYRLVLKVPVLFLRSNIRALIIHYL